ncbi:MAG: hypothetical protein LBC99_07305 [Spirochaetota bacterium]|jgi:tetratricopeptide (TPR) repeat protein|nr:hypothetical protein [Spirochaetota bacterium]
MNTRLRIYAYLILAASIALCACDSFNLFSWAHGDSKNYDSLITDANAALAAGNDAAALESFSKALELRPNDVPALDGCIRAELSLMSSGKTVFSAFPQFFVNRYSVTNFAAPIFANMNIAEQNYFRAHILALRKNVASLGEIYLAAETPLKSQHARFTADAVFVCSMNALLLAEDGNQNGILGDEDDPFYVGAAFDLIPRVNSKYGTRYPFLRAARQEAEEACSWFIQLIKINPDAVERTLYELYANISYFKIFCEIFS